MNHNSASAVRSVLETEGLTPKKRWGQNFLIDANVRRRIVSLLEEPGTVWEIGPGLGSLTELLIADGFRPTLFELDHGLIRHLRELFADSVAIRPGDALETLGEALEEDGSPQCIVGNLPYRSASAIIAKIAELVLRPRRMVFMIQTELADRLKAPAGSQDYSALTVLVQSHYSVARCFSVGSSAFYPAPRVGSAVVTMEPVVDYPDMATSRATSSIARLLFGQRRKTCAAILRQAAKRASGTTYPSEATGAPNGNGGSGLAGEQIRAAAATLGYDLTRRAETFTVAEFLDWGRAAAGRL